MTQACELDQSFVHTTNTHEYHIRWTRCGDPNLAPVIFVHGTPWSSLVWQSLASALSTRYCIYLYDHPGFGSSPPYRRLSGEIGDTATRLDASLSRRAEASAALIKHWNLPQPPHVVAHDNGGLVSLRLLLQQDIQFSSLCLVDVVTSGSSALPFFKTIAENESVFKSIASNLVEGFIRSYIKGATYKSMAPAIEDELTALWMSDRGQGSERFLDEMIQAHHRDASDVEHLYGSVGGRLPTKIIWGKNDDWLPVDIAEKLQKTLDAHELIMVEEAGHLIQYDQPSRLAVEVALWLDRHGNR
jgi:pimeloyl-ACP methyl ester carboxylesterase